VITSRRKANEFMAIFLVEEATMPNSSTNGARLDA
jgi:hypothetical protein